MHMVSSSGKSIRSRRAICSGLHALAQRRACRGPCRRPFQATAGPTTAAPPGVATAPDRRSCTYVRSAALVASFALFGRRAARSACHCAVLARYASPPPRVAALRRNSREIVDAARPSRRAISRMPWPCARHSAISSRSANTRYRPESGFADGASDFGGIPPASRNHRVPTAGDTPASIAAASLNRPVAIAAQNRRRSSRRAAHGRPGERNATRNARSERRLRVPIATSSLKVLRRPRESARPPAANRRGAEAQGAVGEGGHEPGPPGAKGGGSPRLTRLRRLIGRGLEGTAALWPDVERAYGWVHRAAHILSNPDGEDAAKVRRRFDGLLAAMARHRGQAGSLAEAVGHFCKVARSYRPGLFHCYAVPSLPRTDNGLEQLFGSQRHHERRANGRKAASPAAELRGVNRDAWTELRRRLDRRRHARTLRTRFRRDPDAYLAALEQRACQPILPA